MPKLQFFQQVLTKLAQVPSGVQVPSLPLFFLASSPLFQTFHAFHASHAFRCSLFTRWSLLWAYWK